MARKTKAEVLALMGKHVEVLNIVKRRKIKIRQVKRNQNYDLLGQVIQGNIVDQLSRGKHHGTASAPEHYLVLGANILEGQGTRRRRMIIYFIVQLDILPGETNPCDIFLIQYKKAVII